MSNRVPFNAKLLSIVNVRHIRYYNIDLIFKDTQHNKIIFIFETSGLIIRQVRSMYILRVLNQMMKEMTMTMMAMMTKMMIMIKLVIYLVMNNHL